MLLRWVGVLALIHLVCVGADFIFEARLESYQNPSHTIFNGSCCDGPPDGGGACTDPCDNSFIFCIKESNSTDGSSSPENCPLFHDVSSVFQDNDTITFSMNEDLGGGVSNPLSFSGNGTWQGVRFLVRPRDVDGPGSRTMISTLITLVNISSGSDFSSVTFTDELAVFLTMTVSFRVMCTGNSMGPDCGICREGFQNPASGCTETCTPAQGCSPIGGFCNAPDVCVCRDDYSGDNCDIDEDPCAHTTPCQNGGTCVTTESDEIECQCVEGYEGDSCELMVTDECDPTPCQNGGACTDLFQAFECICTEGFEGNVCGNETVECSPGICQNGGTCQDMFLDYMCRCTAGYEGRDCSEGTNECDPNPCQNGGTCEDLTADYSCSCASGFTGRNCAEEEEEDGGKADSVNPPVIGGAVAAGIAVVIIATLVVVLVVLLLKWRQKTVTVTSGGSGQSDTLDILVKPNPVYGVSLQQTPQAPGEAEYYVNEGMGPKKSHDYVYDYVQEAGAATVPIKSNPGYDIPLSENPAYERHS